MGADEQVLTDARAMRAIVDPRLRRYLEPFLGREVETAQAARELGVSTEHMAHRVARLRRLGLLVAVGERTRAGRPVVSYRAAGTIRGSLDLLAEADVTDLFGVMDAEGRRAFLGALSRLASRAHLGEWDVRLYRDDRGRTRVGMSPKDTDWEPGAPDQVGVPPVVFNWVPLHLDEAQARQLQRALLEIVGSAPVDTRRPTHLLGLFLTPLE